jgi:hypothetical protein
VDAERPHRRGPARAAGVDMHRSQVQRILRAEGASSRRTRSWTTSKDRTSPQVICTDEIGPVVIPRAFPPPPGWSPDGYRIKAPLNYSRGPEKTWGDGTLRVADGKVVTMCAPSRNSDNYQKLLQLVERANPRSRIVVITDNLSNHNSVSTRVRLAHHRQIEQTYIPVGTC